jgi:hypothetical protein
MSTRTAIRFDLARFRQAIEQRDSQTQLDMYAPDATVTIADRTNTPGSPLVLSGSQEIRGWLEDVSGREMTHQVGHCVQDDHGVAFTERCRYPDGTHVMCATVLALSDGLIADQDVVQAWDES